MILNPNPYTLNHVEVILDPKPYTLNPTTSSAHARTAQKSEKEKLTGNPTCRSSGFACFLPRTAPRCFSSIQVGVRWTLHPTHHALNTLNTQHSIINTHQSSISTRHSTINNQQSILINYQSTINTQFSSIINQHSTLIEQTLNAKASTLNTNRRGSGLLDGNIDRKPALDPSPQQESIRRQ